MAPILITLPDAALVPGEPEVVAVVPAVVVVLLDELELPSRPSPAAPTMAAADRANSDLRTPPLLRYRIHAPMLLRNMSVAVSLSCLGDKPPGGGRPDAR